MPTPQDLPDVEGSRRQFARLAAATSLGGWLPIALMVPIVLQANERVRAAAGGPVCGQEVFTFGLLAIPTYIICQVVAMCFAVIALRLPKLGSDFAPAVWLVLAALSLIAFTAGVWFTVAK